MKWLIAGAIYLPTYIIGRLLADYVGLDAYLAGWIAGSIAALLVDPSPSEGGLAR